MKVLIVTYRRCDLLRSQVATLRKYFDVSELLVVDNASEESAAIADFCDAKSINIICNIENLGFAEAVNIGMRRLTQTQDPWVLLLNPDTDVLLDPHDLIPHAVSLTACLTTLDAAAEFGWDSAKPIPNPWRAAWEDSGLGKLRLPQPFGSRYRRPSERSTGYLVGCFLLISTSAWQAIGPFDERFWLYSEEVDWCYRAHQAGFLCQVVPITGYSHEARKSVEGDSAAKTRSELAYSKSRILFLEKHWGRPGVFTYRILRRSLVTLRVAAHAARKARR